METKLQVEMLCKALRQLTPSQREVIGLRFAGLSSAEVVKSGAKAAVRSGRSDAPPAIEKLRKLMWREAMTGVLTKGLLCVNVRAKLQIDGSFPAGLLTTALSSVTVRRSFGTFSHQGIDKSVALW